MNNKAHKLISLISLIGLLTLTLFTSGCQTNNQSRPQSNNQSLKVGVILPFTGPAALIGEDFRNGLELAKEKINPNLELYYEDSQTDPKTAVDVTHKLLDSHDINVLVTIQGSISAALAPVANQYKVPLIGSINSAEEFCSSSDYTFRLFPHPSQDAKKAAEFVYQQGFKKVATFTLLDEFGAAMKKYFTQNFPGEIIISQEYEKLTKDFQTPWIKIAQTNPDAILFIGYQPHNIKVVQERASLNINIPIISSTILTDEVVRSEVKDLFQDSDYSVTFNSTLVNEKTKDFVDAYQNKYGKLPMTHGSPFAYDTILILDQIQKSQLSPLESLHQLKINSLNGPISFDQQGEVSLDLIVVKAKDKSIVE